ncbi:MAG: ABC transporter ATP-binding protein [Actinomycetes bacterium]
MSERRVPDLRVTDVTVEFGGLTALQGAHLTAEVGERAVILGPNGAGKTTLFNVIGGTIKPRSGRIEIRGHDVTGRSPRVIRRHGLARAFQTPSVFPTLTVRENLWLGRLYSDPVRWNPFASAHREAAASEITELAERIGLADVLDRPADELSHADQKVLDIGVALAGKPTILLLDEPTQGVSPEDVGRIVSVITETMQDMAVVVIEHDIATVAAIATRVIVLDRGRVIAEGSLAEVSARPEVQEVYLGGGLAELLDEGWDG